jgi:hypothetical protein
MAVQIPKDPSRVARGRLGASVRWGPMPRLVRLDELTSDQRAVVLALIENMKAAPVSERSEAAIAGGTSDADPAA